jgi:hypothetical protein
MITVDFKDCHETQTRPQSPWRPTIDCPADKCLSHSLVLLLLVGFFGLSGLAPLYGAETNGPITVEREKEKTVYSIGSTDKNSTRDDADKAWEMFNNVIIDTRGSHGKGPNNNR